MTTDVARKTSPIRSLHAAAEEMRGLVRRLPRWDPFDPEGWDEFQSRRVAAERALAARLARMPSCALHSSADGWDVELTLAGITVRSRDRLHGTCIAWAAAACR